MRNNSWQKVGVLALVFFSLCACEGRISLPDSENFENENTENVENIQPEKEKVFDLSLADEVYGQLSEKYLRLDEATSEDLNYGLIRGMVAALGDPHTEFMDPEDTKLLEDSLAGDLYGIGAELEKQEDKIVVVSPLKGSPAELAGILPKDVIAAVDGESVVDVAVNEVVMKIRGDEGTKVRLTIWRDSTQKLFDVEVTRARIHLSSVEWSWADEGQQLALVSVNAFNEETSVEFAKAMREVANAGAKGMVLDLRYNGGGFLNDAIDMVSFFIAPELPVTEMRGRGGVVLQTYKTAEMVQKIEFPVVVLVNSGSASASEIVAGALQDEGRATIVGEQTYGKGTVQELIDLSDGSSLRVTIAKWYTPKGRSIDDEGITPDVVVSYTAETPDIGKLFLDQALTTLREKVK